MKNHYDELFLQMLMNSPDGSGGGAPGGGGFRRRGGGGGGRGRSGPRRPMQPVQQQQDDGPYEPNAMEMAEMAKPVAPPVHHDKIELPPAFAALGLEPSILMSLAQIHFKTPSEIQEKMIPVALTGIDVLGQARTGTGKTAAFGLPIIQNIDLSQPFQALVVVPTRELAVQVDAELRRFAVHKPIRFALAYGGTKMSGQFKQLGHNPHVVVGTPGRIMDLQERGALPLQNMRYVVCDEVDRMFDIGFRDDIRKILGNCTTPHQTIFVSATISDDIERMVQKHMRDPARIFTTTKEETQTVSDAKQYYVGVQAWDKMRAIRMLLQQEKPTLAIIFCRTKRAVDKVAAGLEHAGIAASPIHGDLMQNKRERVMRGFRTGKIHVLVATDLASRGIDVHEITHVINYDIPEDPEVYVHRVGRTARMGATGRAFTFVARGEAQLQTEIEKLTNCLLEEYRLEGFVASIEPSLRPGYVPGAHSGQGGGARGAEPQQSAASEAASDIAGGGAHPVQAPTPTAPVEEYGKTGFGDVNLTTATRPLTGRYYTKKRR